MSNIDGWLSRKYDILGQNARTQAVEAASRAGLTDVQARLAPGQAMASNQAALGQAQAATGQAALSRANALQVPGLAQAEEQQRMAAAAQSRAAATVDYSGLAPAPQAAQESFQQQTAPLPNAFPSFSVHPTPPISLPSVGNPTNDLQFETQGGRYSTGTSKVPGMGDGTVDTQKAMLAPGEAVLNKGAAEHLGRTTIDLLNAIGEQKMGLGADPQAHTTQATAGGQGAAQDKGPQRAPGYAKGTSKVPAKGAAPAKGSPPKGAPGKGAAPAKGKTPPAQVSPQLLAALMQMGGGAGAGGMPVPGGQQPMPMPMPMTQG